MNNSDLKIFLVVVVVLAIMILLSGCAAGWTDNAKSIRFQVPALLDVEFEFNDEKGTSEQQSVREIFKP